MNFFSEVDSLGIVESHIAKLQKLEDKQAKALLSRYKEARTMLQDRLAVLPRETFTAQQLSGVLVQVEAGIALMTRGLKDGMREVAPATALEGVEDLLSELAKFDQYFLGAVTPINLNAQLLAQDTANFLLNKYEASIEAYAENLRAKMISELTMASLMQGSLSRTVGDMVSSVGRFFVGEEWKLFRIARTELHGIYNLGKMNGMTATRDEYLPDLMKTMIHPMDARTGEDSKALALIDPIVPINEPFRFRWKGETRVFMAPPDRPNDRAILVPYRQAWEDSIE